MKNELFLSTKNTELIVAYGDSKKKLLEVLNHIDERFTKILNQKSEQSVNKLLIVTPIGSESDNIVSYSAN